MKTRTKKAIRTTLPALILLFAATAGSNLLAGSCSASTAKSDIVATAVEAGSFNTLVAAVEAAGLVEALQGDGPFTVFAPTDEAFAKLPAGTLESLLKPENKGKLTAILTYHVAPGRLLASDVVSRESIETLNGQQPVINANGHGVKIDQANVIKTDIVTANGVIHVIDEVILPREESSARTEASYLIESAISRGVPLFNEGQPEACSAVYQMAAQGLVGLGGEALTAHEMNRLQDAMLELESTNDARARAWLMRHALDDVHASLQSRDAGEMMARLGR